MNQQRRQWGSEWVKYCGREARGTGISSSNRDVRLAASAWSLSKIPSCRHLPRLVASDDVNFKVGEGLPEGEIYLTEGGDLAGVTMGMNGRGSDAYLVGRSLIHLGRRPSSRR